MTADQKLIIDNLSKCRLTPGSWNKRFIKSLAGILHTDPEKELSENQIEWMFRMLYTYRKQLATTYDKFTHIPECAPKP